MNCRLVELRHKEVINKQNGCRIGCVDDLEIDSRNACVVAIIIYGRPKCFGLFGRYDDFIIPWKSIDLIGEDTILVSCEVPQHQKRRKRPPFFKVI